MNRQDSGVLHHLWRALTLARSTTLRAHLSTLVKEGSPKTWNINGGSEVIVKVTVLDNEIVRVETSDRVSVVTHKTIRPGRELSYVLQVLKTRGESITVVTV